MSPTETRLTFQNNLIKINIPLIKFFNAIEQLKVDAAEKMPEIIELETNELPSSPHRLHRHVFLLGIVLLTGIIAYANSLNGPFQFDDVGISDKARLIARAYSTPARQVADFSFLLNHGIHGKNVLGFHLLNLLIHLCSATTVYFLAAGLIHALAGAEPEKSEETRFISRFVPFATALLFVCHPVQTQAVTYIVQRYTSLATLFYLFSLLMFIRARIRHLQGAGRAPVWFAGMAAVISGFLSMRCKEIAFTLPVMLVIVELFIFNGRLLRNRFFLAGMAVLLLVIPAQQIIRHGATGIDDLVYGINKGTREELTYSRVDYLQTQFRVVVTYVRILFFPVNQNLDYDYPLQKVFLAPAVVLSLLFHLLMLTTATVLFFKSRRYLKGGDEIHGACARLCSLGIAWFYVALMVESSIIPIVDVIFEHRVYLPSAGFFLAVTSAAAGLIARRATTRKRAWIALAVIGLVLTTATIRRNTVWLDELRLWEDTAGKSPHKPRVLNNLATYYLARNMPGKAIDPLLKALEREPGSPESLNNLGLLLDQVPEVRGRYDNGRKYLNGDNSVNVRFITPWAACTRNNLGLVYELQGNRTKAVELYEKAAALDPANEAAWLNLALAYARQGSTEKMAGALDKLRRLNPVRAGKVETDIFTTRPRSQ